MKINSLLFFLGFSNYSQFFRGKNINSDIVGDSLQGNLPRELVGLPYIQNMYVTLSYSRIIVLVNSFIFS